MHRTFFKVFWQTLWQVIAKGVSLFSTSIVLAMVARNYGASGTGTYTLVTTYLAMFFIVADLGLNAYVLPRLSDNSSEANKLFNLRLYWSIALALIAIGVAFVLPNVEFNFKFSVVLGVLTIVFSGVFTSIQLIFQNNLKFHESALAVALGSLMLIPLMFILVWMKLPVEYLILSSVGAWFTNLVVASVLVSKIHKFKLAAIDTSFLSGTFKNAWPISLTLIFNVIYFRIDAFILSSTRSIAEVGIYNLAYSLFQSALVIPTFIMNSYYPIILKEMQDTKVLFRQLKMGFLIMMLLAIIGMLLTFLTSDLVVGLLTGKGFEDSAEVLDILALSFPAFFGSAFLMWVLVSFKKYYELVLIYGLGLLINVTLNGLYTPHYSYFSTSWITVLSEYVILLMQGLALLRILDKGDKKS